MRILVIEDDAEGRGISEQGLAESGREVVCAHDFAPGFALAQGGGFDALVIDRMLPEVTASGWSRPCARTG